MLVTQSNSYLRNDEILELAVLFIRRLCHPIVLLILFISVSIFLTYPILGISRYYERLYNEGYNLYHAVRLERGEELFKQNPFATNNYPFLSFYITILIGKIAGCDLLFVGRWLSLIGMLGAAVSLYSTSRSLRCTTSEALLGTGIAIGLIFVTAAAPWVASDDPQFLGQCFSMAGLAVYVRNSDRAWAIVAVAILVLLAGFTKHNLIAVPMAVSVDLLFGSRRRLLIWVVTVVLGSVFMLVVQRLVAGPDFVAAVLGAPRMIDMFLLTAQIRWVWLTMHIPLAIAAIVALVGRPIPRIYILFFWAAAAEVLLFSPGEGVSYNILLELVFAVGMGCALAQFLLRQVGAALRIQVATAIVATIPINYLGLDSGQRLPRLNSDINAVESSFKDDVSWLAARPGKVICESMLLCLKSGHELIIDPYNSRQMILAHRLDEFELIQQVNTKQFTVIQLRAQIILNQKGEIATPTFLKFERFTKKFLLAVAAHYRIDRESGDRVFYVPKATPESGHD